jgi:hypothetical protein
MPDTAAQDSAVPPAGKIDIGTPYRGILRHRSIVAACLAFSGVVLVASTIDLKQMIGRPAMIDPGKHFSYLHNQTELPANVTFAHENYNYGEIRPLTEGLRPVLQTGWEQERYGFIDEHGKMKIKPQFAGVGDFHEGMAWVKVKPDGDKSKELQGFINAKGQILIKPQFTNAGNFCNGLAPVVTDEFGALIDKTGKIVFKVKSSTLPEHLGAAYSVYENGKYHLIGHDGSLLNDQKSLPHDQGYDRIEAFNAYSNAYHCYDRFLNETGSSFSPNQVVHMGGNSCDDERKVFKVYRNGKWGVIDASGKIVIPLQFDEIWGYASGYGIIRNSQALLHFVDAEGKIVESIKPFNEATMFGDLTAIHRDNEWELIGADGKLLTDVAHFDEPIIGQQESWFSDGLGPVLIEGKCGYLNAKGQIAIPATFEFAAPFRNGLALVWDGSYWSFINTRGEIVKFDGMSQFSNATHFCKNGAAVEVPGSLYWMQKAKLVDEVNSNLKTWKDQAEVNCSFKHHN